MAWSRLGADVSIMPAFGLKRQHRAREGSRGRMLRQPAWHCTSDWSPPPPPPRARAQVTATFTALLWKAKGPARRLLCWRRFRLWLLGEVSSDRERGVCAVRNNDVLRCSHAKITLKRSLKLPSSLGLRSECAKSS